LIEQIITNESVPHVRSVNVWPVHVFGKPAVAIIDLIF
jgi:hypothetical protein